MKNMKRQSKFRTNHTLRQIDPQAQVERTRIFRHSSRLAVDSRHLYWLYFVQRGHNLDMMDKSKNIRVHRKKELQNSSYYF